MADYEHMTECEACDGYGFIPPAHRMGETLDCEACDNSGFRAMTSDEIADAAADAWSDMCESEPPMSIDERHQIAWRQHQELHR